MRQVIRNNLITLGSHNLIIIVNSEKYSRGRRGAPAKGVGRATGARVQIPLSPLKKETSLRCLFFVWQFTL